MTFYNFIKLFNNSDHPIGDFSRATAKDFPAITFADKASKNEIIYYLECNGADEETLETFNRAWLMFCIYQDKYYYVWGNNAK